MIDTHSHLLPGLDHGCPDIETSVRMARKAAQAGIETIVCTPHLVDLDARLMERARQVQAEVEAALRAEAVDVRLLLGFEADFALVAIADVETLRSLTIEGSNGAILIETPYLGWPPFIEETIFRLSTTGFLPILAHPERNERVQRSPQLLSRCLSAGAIAQGTAGSLSPQFRRESMHTFLTLLSRGDLSLLASDAHAHAPYTWTLAPLFNELERRISGDGLDMLTRVNPELALSGRKPPSVKPSQYPGSWWGKRMRPGDPQRSQRETP